MDKSGPTHHTGWARGKHWCASSRECQELNGQVRWIKDVYIHIESWFTIMYSVQNRFCAAKKKHAAALGALVFSQFLREQGEKNKVASRSHWSVRLAKAKVPHAWWFCESLIYSPISATIFLLQAWKRGTLWGSAAISHDSWSSTAAGKSRKRWWKLRIVTQAVLHFISAMLSRT